MAVAITRIAPDGGLSFVKRGKADMATFAGQRHVATRVGHQRRYAQTSAGAAYELDAIAAVVIGGTSMAGGVGTLVGTLFGVLIIGVMNNGLDLLGVQSYYQQIIKGALIVVAVLLDPSRKQQRD